MKIGELATATHTLVETIRYYERQGLLPEPTRTAGNYRAYEEPHLERLAFIRRCRALDMTLDEVRALLQFVDAPGPDCASVNALFDEHIGQVARRISELRRLEKELRRLRAQCDTPRPSDACGVLKGLSIETTHRRRPVAEGHRRGNGVHRRRT